MYRKFIVLFLLLGLTNIFGALVVNEVIPNDEFKNVKFEKVIIFPFDGKKIANKYDVISLSKDLQKDIVLAFNNRTKISAYFQEKYKTSEESIRLNYITGSLAVKDYKERSDSKKIAKENHIDKTIPVMLVGTIDEFYPAPLLRNSYISITFHLIDTKSKVVYWASTIKGCYSFVVNSLVDSIEQREFIGPTIKDEKFYEWINPKTDRLLLRAFGYNLGGVFPFSKLNAEINSFLFGQLDFYFTLPYLLPVQNKVSIGIPPALNSKTYDYVKYIIIPINLTFKYALPFINVDNLFVSPKIFIGLLYENISFPGLKYNVDPINEFLVFSGHGVEVEYLFNPMSFRYKSFLFYIPKTGIIANFNFSFFEFRNSVSLFSFSSYFNFNLGFKIYY